MNTYHDTAKTLRFPTQALIDGVFRDAFSGERFDTVNPATGEVIAQVAACESADVDAAVASARRAFTAGVWSGLHPEERKKVLQKLGALIEENLEDLAILESMDAGKPVSDCLEVDVPETARCIVWHGEMQDKLFDQIAPSDASAVGLIVREPVGVVAAVLPWNFPLLMMAWKIGPALATGNSVIVKPAEQTSLTALRLGELALEAGVPPGVLNVVPGMGPTAGAALGAHMDVDALTFTGSTEVGKLFLMQSAQSNLKEVCLEMGGKSAAVVLQDARDLDRIAELQANAIFWNMGENCTANSRVIAHTDIYDDLLAKLVANATEWQIGDPLDPGVRIGPLVTAEHRDKVVGLIRKGIDEGARLMCGGDDHDGLHVKPTIFADVSEDMTIFQTEIFGPVLTVTRAGSDEHAIELANNSDYGLAASLYTADVAKAHSFARRLNAGTVSVNAYAEGDISTPFGGFKHSGFGGRDNGVEAHDQYTERKTIWIDLTG